MEYDADKYFALSNDVGSDNICFCYDARLYSHLQTRMVYISICSVNLIDEKKIVANYFIGKRIVATLSQ